MKEKVNLSHTFNPVIIRKYDVRGVYGEQLFDKDAYFFGLTFANFILNNFDEKFNKKVIVGRDGRLSSPSLHEELTQGLTDGGIDIIDIGIASTPMVHFAGGFFNSIASVQITASHNPKEHNGLKFDFKQKPFFDNNLLSLKDMVANCKLAKSKGKIEISNIENEYIKHIFKNIDINAKGKNISLKVCLDCGNGATGNVVKSVIKILQENGIEADAIFTDIDGNFPNHVADPIVEKNMVFLMDKVKNENYDAGFGFDGDGDRLGVVDSSGRLLTGEQELLIFARDILEKNKGAKIVVNVLTSQMFYNEIQKVGGETYMVKTGNAFIRTKLDEINGLLGGETSGHINFKDKFNGVDDGLYACLRMIEILLKNKAQKKPDLKTQIDSLPRIFSSGTINLPVREEEKFEIIDNIVNQLRQEKREFIDLDGARVNIPSGDGVWMVRASNTTPTIVLYCEGSTEDDYKKAVEEVKTYLIFAGFKSEFSF